jgi:hypothetical protein
MAFFLSVFGWKNITTHIWTHGKNTSWRKLQVAEDWMLRAPDYESRKANNQPNEVNHSLKDKRHRQQNEVAILWQRYHVLLTTCKPACYRQNVCTFRVLCHLTTLSYRVELNEMECNEWWESKGLKQGGRGLSEGTIPRHSPWDRPTGQTTKDLTRFQVLTATEYEGGCLLGCCSV